MEFMVCPSFLCSGLFRDRSVRGSEWCYYFVKVIVYGVALYHHCHHNQHNWTTTPGGKSIIIIHSIYYPWLLEHSTIMTGGGGELTKLAKFYWCPPRSWHFDYHLGANYCTHLLRQQICCCFRNHQNCMRGITGSNPYFWSKLLSLCSAYLPNTCNQQTLMPYLLQF